MSDLKKFDLPELLDLLSRQTAFHIRVISQGERRSDVESSKAALKRIQAEIEERKMATSKLFNDRLPGYITPAE